MTRTQVEARMGTLRDELTKANEELGKLRPRVQFLEQIMLRIDGGLTVCQEFLDAETPALDMREVHAAYTPEAPPPIPPGTAGPHVKSDAEFAPSWQTVAP